MFRAGGYRSVENYLSKIKDSHIGKVCHLEVDMVHSWVDWTLPFSTTDVRALGRVRRRECVCSGNLTKPCPFHAVVYQLVVLRLLHGGELPGFPPLFPTLGIVDKRCVVASIEFVASLTGEVLPGFGGVRRFGGHSLRVTGARLMAGMGISIVLIQLMARWSSGAVLRHAAEAPLQGMSDTYRKGLSTTALGETAEGVLRQLEVVKSEAAHDERLIHQLQHEVAMFQGIEDVEEKDSRYIMNIEFGVVHRSVVWAKNVAPKRWRTVCGWAFGFSRFKVSLVSPARAVICGGCSRQRMNGYLYATPGFLDFLHGNSARVFVYFGGPSIDSNTLWLVGGCGGGYGCDVMDFFSRDGTVLTEVDFVKFSDCYFFGDREDSASAPTTGSVVVVVSEGGCGRYSRDRSSLKAWCETSSHVKVELVVDACGRLTRGTSRHRTKRSGHSGPRR